MLGSAGGRGQPRSRRALPGAGLRGGEPTPGWSLGFLLKELGSYLRLLSKAVTWSA